MTTRKTTRKAPSRKARAKKAPPAGILLPVSHEERWRMIAETAYYMAQKRGFVGDESVSDWLSAEAAVDAKLRAEGREPR